MCRLSVVVPIYQEAHRMPESLPKLARALAALEVAHEVLLVIEPGSDDSQQVAEAIAARYGWLVLLPPVHQGKGGAVRRGMLAARGEIVCYMDADMSTDLSALGAVLETFAANPGLGIVIGDRRHPQSVFVRPQGWLRRTLGRLFNFFVRMLFPSLRTRDTQCGFKAFSREATQQVFSRQQLNGFAFDVEALVLARRLGFTMKAIPVRWTDGGRSSVKLLRDGRRMLADLLRLRFCGSRLRTLE